LNLIWPGKDPSYGVDSVGTISSALVTYADIQALKPDLIINAGIGVSDVLSPVSLVLPEVVPTVPINVNQKCYAVVSAIAASAIPSLVLTRGHQIETVPELPLVVGDSAEGVEKTKEAIKLLKSIGAYPDAGGCFGGEKEGEGRWKEVEDKGKIVLSSCSEFIKGIFVHSSQKYESATTNSN
jgi:hypothetical protein